MITITLVLIALVGLACSSPVPNPTSTTVPQSQVPTVSAPVPSPKSTFVPAPSPTVSLRDLVPPELIATTAPVPIATIQPPFSIILPTPTDLEAGLSITSDAFKEGHPIPQAFTCDGDDDSPPIAWGDIPNGARSFALIVNDPDAPVGVFTHWVLYNLPGDADRLPQGVPKEERLDNGALQGRNDFRNNNIGYSGPCPPRGSPHRYRFNLYALDGPLDLDPGASKQQVLDAMQGHILGDALLIGIYQRGGG